MNKIIRYFKRNRIQPKGVAVLLALIAFVCSTIAIMKHDTFFVDKSFDFFIASISIVASSVGLSLSAFIFLNDSLKKRAEADKKLKRIVDGAIKSKYKELLLISFISIVCILLCVIINVKKTDLDSYPHDKWIVFGRQFPFSLSIAIVAYIITFSAFNISSTRIIKSSAYRIRRREEKKLDEFWEMRKVEPNRHREIGTYSANLNIDSNKSNEKNVLKALQAWVMENPFELTSIRLNKTKNTIDKDNYVPLAWFNKTVQQIDTIIKTICMNNVNKDAGDDEDRLQEEFTWLFCDIKEYENGKAVADKQDSSRYWDLIWYALYVMGDDIKSPERVGEFKNVCSCLGLDDSSIMDEDKDKKLAERIKLITNKLKSWFYNESVTEKDRCDLINDVKKRNKELLKSFFECYNHLMRYKEATNICAGSKHSFFKKIQNWCNEPIHEDCCELKQKILGEFKRVANSFFDKFREKNDTKEVIGEICDISIEIYHLAHTTLQLLLDRFGGFVQLSGLNLGGAWFNKAWLNRSDLSNSSFVNSNFKYSRFENGVLKNCNVSASTFENAYLVSADLSGSNFNYTSFIGSNCESVNFSNSLMDDVLFRRYRHIRIDFNKYADVAKETAKEIPQKEMPDESEIKSYLKTNSKENVFGLHSIESDSSIELIRIILNLQQKRLTDINSIKEDIQNAFFPDEQVQCRAAILRNATLNNVILRDLDLGNVPLNSAAFVDSIITGAIFSDCDECKGVNFTNANLGKARFYNVNFEESVFYNSNLYSALFLDTVLMNASLEKASMMKVLIVGLANNEKQYALTEGINNQSAKRLETWKSYWAKVKLTSTIMVQAVVLNTCMDQSNFNKVNMKEAILHNTMFRWSSFVKSDLSFALITFCSFFQSNMQEVQLPKTKFFGCDFTNAKIDYSLLINTEIVACAFCKTAIRNSTFSHVEFRDCVFIDAVFIKNTMVDTQFNNCIFWDVTDFNERATYDSCVFYWKEADRERLQEIIENKDYNHNNEYILIN